VGWRPRRVLGMILAESLLLSFLGGLIGLGAGAGLTALVASTPAMAGLTSGKVPLTLVIQALFTALVLGAVGGIYPAWRASRLPPVEALSYDGGSGRDRAVNLPFGGMALRGLLRQRMRTTLTVLGLGIGVLSIILVASLGEGATAMFSDLFASTEISAVERDQPDTSLSVIDERDLRRIEALPEVQYVTGTVMGVVGTSNNPFFVITGRAPTDPALQQYVLREGGLFSSSRECVLGWKAAAEQKRGIGDTLALLGTRFSVVGLVETGSTFEDSGAIIPLREAQRLLKKPNQVMWMQVKLRDPAQTDAMVERLSQDYPELHFSRSADLVETLPDMESTNQMIGGITVLTVIISAIVLANTMIMSVYERTREIGVLRAVGWRRLMVLRQVIVEAVLLTLMSGLAALVVAWTLIAAVRRLVGGTMYGDMFVITPGIIVQAMLVCVVLGVLGGLYPAWRATRLSPVEALRYE
jgi:ABC-type antimicrobial peptide transport system permease subunit